MKESFFKCKSHPDFWKIHKEIWQQECDSLSTRERAIIMNQPWHIATKDFNKEVCKEVERKLLFSVE